MDIIKAFNSNDLHCEIVIKGTYNEPLFRAIDIGEILEMTNIRVIMKSFDDADRQIQIVDTSTGPKQVTFLTEKGLYKVLFKSRKPIAEKFQNWVCEVIKEIRLTGEYNMKKEMEEAQKQIKEKEEKLQEAQKEIQDKEQQLEETQEKLEEAEKKINEEKIPSIYIYNTDITKELTELKIGYTTNVYSRIRPYKQVCKHGRLEYSYPIYHKNIKTFENTIHQLLSDHLIKDEVFRIDVEEAKHNIISIINSYELNKNINIPDRQLKLKKIVDYENQIIHNQSTAISTREIFTQTDFDEPAPVSAIPAPLIEETPLTKKFNQFIDEFCIVRPDVEENAKAIEGQYRLWSGSATKDVFHALHDYLRTRFKYNRIIIQNTKQSHYGFVGVKLKEIEYHKHPQPSNEQNFIFQSCVFSPAGKVLHQDLLKEYVEWKQNVKQPITTNEDKELKQYLKSTGYTLESPVWTSNGNGVGYYGVSLKTQIDTLRKVSTTGKKVEKRCAKTNQVLKTWDTILLAAQNENCSAKTISRGITSKKFFNDDYYFCLSQ